MHIQAQEHIHNLTNDELMEYIEEGVALYDPDAIAFARQELDRRDVVPERLAQMESNAEMRVGQRSADTHEIATRCLGTWGRILAFIAGMFFFPLLPMLIAWNRFKGRGEHRKARELWLFAGIGFGSIIGFAIVATLVSRLMDYLQAYRGASGR